MNHIEMSLQEYGQNRNFNATAEPKGVIKKGRSELIFVVQKHAASHLHYDFRLESDGVLKSWVIPKGPSMNPKDKRLAIMVEDHPYNYKDFEGVIPEGNYGAGNVIVWDNGTYSLVEGEGVDNRENKIKKDLKNGHLSFVLKGNKLKGEFTLLKLKTKQANTWLLIKSKDRHASGRDILLQDKSVISNMTIDSQKNKLKE
ncbi:DNA polymerase ligase N-terminal domain-containing protein [Flavobacterium sp. LB2P44]|uniref:DNA polymerase ligase N-terminal domain-containing protein n=1 Tax=Flavobacterium sp. LB2P44 TaxID=3401713 RepID=UPI003AAA7855